MAETILRVENLRTHYHLRGGRLTAVEDVSFEVKAGKVLGIVGESGCGKSVTALSIMRLIDPPGRIVSGRIFFRDRDLLTLPEPQMEAQIRGNRIGMIFQDPMTSLNPAFPIGEQIAEGITAHLGVTRDEARRRAVSLLTLVGIPHAADNYGTYPHHFSGGMRQRVLIAAAIACEPDLLIADEPTTALDVTIQAQILRLLSDLQKRLDSAMILITHDLGVVAAMADTVMVMYAGSVVESADVRSIFRNPKHPYTQALLGSIIDLDAPRHLELRSIPGSPPVPMGNRVGCSFRDRCPYAMPYCATETPRLTAVDETAVDEVKHFAACHLIGAEAECPVP